MLPDETVSTLTFSQVLSYRKLNTHCPGQCVLIRTTTVVVKFQTMGKYLFIFQITVEHNRVRIIRVNLEQTLLLYVENYQGQ